MAIDYDTQRDGEHWLLLVNEEDRQLALTQINLYQQENAHPPRAAREAALIDSGWAGVAGYLVVIWTLPLLQSNFTGIDWLAHGRLDAAAVTSGEIWRVATALTLHGDIAHIAGNSLFGVVFGLFVGRYVGSGMGWLTILICGCVANLANALIQPAGFKAIGASTATFAALGLVPMFTWRSGYFPDRGWQRNFAPLFGAITILVFTGLGGENTDVVGHIFGFIAGLAGGYVLTRIKLDHKSKADQQRAGSMALILVLFAWLMAL